MRAVCRYILTCMKLRVHTMVEAKYRLSQGGHSPLASEQSLADRRLLGSRLAGHRARRASPSLPWLGLVCLLALLAGGPWSCASFRDPQAVLRKLEPNQALPLSWRVSGGPGAELYILGSIHLGPPAGWRYPPSVLATFEESKALVVELDPEEIAAPSWQFLINYYGNLPPGGSLQMMVSPETWTLLKESLADSGLPLRAAERMRPWLITNLLTSEATRELGFSSLEGTDRHFIRNAGERSVISLETASNLLSRMASLPSATQELALLDTLNHYDEANSFVELTVDAWRAGDERTLEDLIFEDHAGTPDLQPLYQAMFFDRNREMSNHLEVLLDAEQHAGELVFVVLGVGHLIGDQGIPSLLREKHYQVQRTSRREMEVSLSGRRSLAVDP